MGVEDLSGVCQGDALLCSYEQFYADRLLQSFDRLTYGWLRYTQLPGSGGYTGSLGDVVEDLVIFEIYVHL